MKIPGIRPEPNWQRQDDEALEPDRGDDWIRDQTPLDPSKRQKILPDDLSEPARALKDNLKLRDNIDKYRELFNQKRNQGNDGKNETFENFVERQMFPDKDMSGSNVAVPKPRSAMPKVLDSLSLPQHRRNQMDHDPSQVPENLRDQARGIQRINFNPDEKVKEQRGYVPDPSTEPDPKDTDAWLKWHLGPETIEDADDRSVKPTFEDKQRPERPYHPRLDGPNSSLQLERIGYRSEGVQYEPMFPDLQIQANPLKPTTFEDI